MRNKVLVHPALQRAIAEAEAEMEQAMAAAYDGFMDEVNELRRELAEARREVAQLRNMAVRDPRETLH
jgi:hypothetical protein